MGKVLLKFEKWFPSQSHLNPHPQIKAKNPGLSLGEMGKALGAAWKELGAKDKEKYEAQAKTEKVCVGCWVL